MSGTQLTPREKEVATLVAGGLTNREIAERLVISERTAEGHIEQIRNKLGFRSRSQVASWATAEGLGIDAASTRRVSSRPRATQNNLPAQLSSFVGRRREVAELESLLAKHRLVTLAGAGGTGKTRLSLQLAKSLLDRYPDGAFFVDLAVVTDPSLVWVTIGAALGLRGEVTGSHPAAARADAAVLDHLRDRIALLVLDNCEHLIDACAAAAQRLLSGSESLRIVATSREPLRVNGERVWRIPSLAESEELFRDRAGSMAPAFTLREEHAPLITRICERLDRMPLAIELAVARLNLLSLEQIAAKLDDRFGLLTGGSRTSMPRQKTLRATIDWSYDLLSADEHVVWRRLSVFSGFTLEAAETVCAKGVAVERVLDLVSQLVDKSLVVAEMDPDGSPRDRLLETLRDYAEGQLLAAGEADEVRRRHAEYFLDFAERARPHLVGGAGQPAWFDRLEDELGNLRSAVSWLIEHDPAAAVRIGVALGIFWQIRGYVADGLRWRNGVLPMLRTVAHELRAPALRLAGVFSVMNDEHERARELYGAALELFQEAGDEEGVSVTLLSLGRLAASRGDDTDAEQYFERSLVLVSRQGNRGLTSDALHELAHIAFRRGDLSLARERFEESARICAGIEDRVGEAGSLLDLAMVSLDMEDPAAAEGAATDSLSLYREVGARGDTTVALNTLGHVAQYRGDLTGALAYHTEALAIARELRRRHALGITLLLLAECALTQGQLARAGALASEALDLIRESHSSVITWCWEITARIATSTSRWDRAARLFGATSEAHHGSRFATLRYIQHKTDDSIGRTRVALGEGRFAQLWSEGATMTRADTNSYAAETLGVVSVRR